MKHLGTVELNTERLILRKFRSDDASMVYENWSSDEVVYKYTGDKYHKSITDTETRLQKWIENYEKDDYYRWTIVTRDCEEVIGIIMANYIAEGEYVHMAYFLSPKFWSIGYTTEAFRRVIKFFFEEVGMNRVEAMYHPENMASGEVMKKCGLTREGVLRQALKTNISGFTDMIICSILAEEYFERKVECYES